MQNLIPESEKHKIQAGIEAGKGLQKEWNDCPLVPEYFSAFERQSRDTHEKTAQKDVKHKVSCISLDFLGCV